MTPTQLELARHALGLPNRDQRTYRSRFCAGPGHPDHEAWMAMVSDGNAVRRDGATLPFGGDDLFFLTPKGAKAALLSGERLDEEDFAEVGHG